MPTTFRATVEHVHHTTSKVAVRTHTMLVDRGIAKGGFGGALAIISVPILAKHR